MSKNDLAEELISAALFVVIIGNIIFRLFYVG